MATQAHTADGTTERGNANQRHFVRAVDNDADGAHVVVSLSSGSVRIASEEAGVNDVLDLAVEYGGEASLGMDEKGWRYKTGSICLNVQF